MLSLLRYSWLVLPLLTACAPRPQASDYPRIASYALENTDDTPLAKAYAHGIAGHPGESGFHLLANGPDALMMRIALINASRKSVDLQYFSTEDDTTGKLLLEAVLRAAQRGVRVRMLLDDLSLDDFRAGAAALNSQPNISIRVFNPYATRDESLFERAGNVFSYLHKFDRRMHNKALIADNQIAIMGGRNLGDEYFDASRDLDFHDVDVFAVGPVTKQISHNFDRYWNNDESFPIETLNMPAPDHAAIAQIKADMQTHWDHLLQSTVGRHLKELPLPHKAQKGEVPLIWATAELVADSPKKIDAPEGDAISKPGMQLEDLIDHAQQEVMISSPYLVPLDDGVTWLNSLVARGIQVRIITNSLASTDMVPASAGYERYREALVKGGVGLYEIKPTARPSAKKMFKPSSQNGLHAKIYMIDRRDLVIGSFNLDARSRNLNTEQVLVIHSPELCRHVANIFSDIMSPEASYRLVLAKDIPADQQSLFTGGLAWKTEEHGQTVYYDFNPQAGFARRATDAFFSLLPLDNEL